MGKLSLPIISCFLSLIVSCTALAFAQTPSDPLAQARSLMAAGKLADSETAVRTYLGTYPASPDAHFLLGYILFREQKAKDSLAEFTAGAKFRRPHPDELKIVASDYVILSDYADADKWFSAIVVETPEDADAWYLLGRTKFSESNFVDAISNFEHALTLRSKYVEAENNIGLAWRELNHLDKAQAAFQTAIDWQGSAPADAQPFLNLGAMFADQHEFDKALPFLNKAVTLSPDNPRIHEVLGQVYAAQQDLPKAQSELQQAIALSPNTSALHFKLGQIYRKEGLLDRAQKEFDMCTRLSGTTSSTKTPNPLSVNPPEAH